MSFTARAICFTRLRLVQANVENTMKRFTFNPFPRIGVGNMVNLKLNNLMEYLFENRTATITLKHGIGKWQKGVRKTTDVAERG